MGAPVTLLVGTTKGLFLVGTDGSVSGPFCGGCPINHAVGAGDRIWAGGGGAWEGAMIWRSEDAGATWQGEQLTRGERDDWARNDPAFAAMIDWADAPRPFADRFEQIWSLAHAHGVLWAGAKPATLLKSTDGGKTWQEAEGLSNHPGRAGWTGGAAGLTLHSLVPHPEDPRRMWLAISAAGMFATEDGGVSWDRRNRLSNARAGEGHSHPAAPAHGETGHCVHSVQRAPGNLDILYQQNHYGVWRSADGGRSWDDITPGLPSTFGFPIRVHPRDPQTVWTFPLNGDSAGRFPPDAAPAVWRTRDGGASWRAQRAGLPERAWFTVLRQAMAGDGQEPAGVYFGTNTGSVFASRDEGDSWAEIARHLPTILCVEVLDPMPAAGDLPPDRARG